MQTARASIRKNIAYGFSSWIVPIALGILTTPIIVRSLGPHEYGIYSLIVGFAAYSFYFNIGRAITKYVSEYRSSDETEKIRDVVSATLVINLAVGSLSLTATLLLAPWVVSDVFQIEGSMRAEAVTALNIAGFMIFSLMLGQVFHAVLQGVNRFDVYSKIQNSTSLLLMSGSVVLVLAGYGLVALFYWNLFITLLNCSLAAISARRLLPEMRFTIRLDGAVVKQVLRYSSAVVGYQVAANIILLFERGWITARLGPESLTYYVVPMTLGILLHSFIFSLMMTLFPLASELSEERDQLLRLYKKATKVVCFIVVFALTMLIALNHTILDVWMGADFSSYSSTLLIFHAITFGILSVAVIAFQLSEGMGFPAFGFWTTLGILVISLPLMIWLSGSFGNVGVAAARLAGSSLLIPAILYLEHWAFGKVQRTFWVKVMCPLLLSALVAGAFQKLLESFLPTTWFTLLLIAAAGGAAYCGSLLLLGFIGDDEKELFAVLRRRVRG